jgi:hypothetical protein
MLTDEEAKQLVKDVGKMAKELASISRTDKDPARRAQAKRWWDTLMRVTGYAKQCSGRK